MFTCMLGANSNGTPPPLWRSHDQPVCIPPASTGLRWPTTSPTQSCRTCWSADLSWPMRYSQSRLSNYCAASRTRIGLRLQLSGDVVSRLVDHARGDVCAGLVLWPVSLPGMRVGRVADGVGAVTQVDGSVVVDRVEVRDGADPLSSVPEQRDRGDVLVGARRQGIGEAPHWGG